MVMEKEIQPRKKREVIPPSEQTRPYPVFTPSVDIYESDNDLVLIADMPGVSDKDLNIDLRDDILTIVADVENPEGKEEAVILREYRWGRYYRQFNLIEDVDRDKISATLKDGVLKLVMPKAQKAKPIKIKVQGE
jgi:HSP20 family molecular chaperone IbpA